MKEVYYKTKNISEITIIDKTFKNHYVYLEKYKDRFLIFFGKTYYKCFIRTTFLETEILTKQEVLNDKTLIIEDNKVYVKPVVYVQYKDCSPFYKYFDTFIEANKWAKKVIEDAGLTNELIKFTNY